MEEKFFKYPSFYSSTEENELYKMPARRKPLMSPFTRLGIALLVVGAIIVGLGTYYDRGAISLYGLLFVVAGFVLYFASSIITYKKTRK
jgi:hypothetical protein